MKEKAIKERIKSPFPKTDSIPVPPLVIAGELEYSLFSVKKIVFLLIFNSPFSIFNCLVFNNQFSIK